MFVRSVSRGRLLVAELAGEKKKRDASAARTVYTSEPATSLGFSVCRNLCLHVTRVNVKSFSRTGRGIENCRRNPLFLAKFPSDERVVP
jgi:hypothetical protein